MASKINIDSAAIKRNLDLIHLSACWTALGRLARWKLPERCRLRMHAEAKEPLAQQTVAAWAPFVVSRGVVRGSAATYFQPGQGSNVMTDQRKLLFSVIHSHPGEKRKVGSLLQPFASVSTPCIHLLSCP